MMFKEYDTVVLTSDLNSQEGVIPKGTLGAILMVFDGELSSYEVEFVDETGQTVGIETVPETALRAHDCG